MKHNKAIPSIGVKDEFDITKGVWVADEHSESHDGIHSEGGKYYPLIATVTKKGFGVAQSDNAKAICTAVNETYGKGYNPAAMEELYKALERIASVDNSGQKLDGHDAEGFIRIAKTALHNAKTIKP